MKRSKTFRVWKVIGYGVEFGLLLVAWFHVHWSVALVLTLLTVEFELFDYPPPEKYR